MVSGRMAQKKASVVEQSGSESSTWLKLDEADLLGLPQQSPALISWMMYFFYGDFGALSVYSCTPRTKAGVRRCAC